MRGGHQTTSNNHYDAGIVLIDLHQLNVKQLQTIQISDTEYGATSCQQRRTEPAEQQPATSAFLTKMIEQINIALLSKKGPGISQPGSLKPAVGDQRQKREHIHH